MPGIDLAAAYAILHLAAAPVAIECKLPRAPVIDVRPETGAIQYEFGLSSEELGRMKSTKDSPYGAGVDVATGGMRADTARTMVKVAWRSIEYPKLGILCMWYDRVEVNITLNPTIYLANDGEFKGPRCRAGILEHEHKHVAVDRQIMNKYARDIGAAVQKEVNGTLRRKGALGPFRKSDEKKVQEALVKKINSVVEHVRGVMQAEMQRRQGMVDSLPEYERINKICNDEKQLKNRK